jgi:monoamine oxidase
MTSGDIEVAIVGGGAAGVSAARRLHDAGLRCLMIEARPRLGGRAWTVIDPSGFAIDLGCGWLHSADRNPWSDIAASQGSVIDKTPPPWTRPSLTYGFSIAEQHDFLKVSHAFYQRLDQAEQHPEQPASALLEPGNRWNNLIIAINTFVAGAELSDISAHDLARYEDSGVDWRMTDGYGTLISNYAADVPARLGCPVHRIDRSGLRLRIETAMGVVTADQAIIAVPTSILTDENFFTPALADKVEAAQGLPLGLDDKLFLSLDRAEEFEKGSRLFGCTDRTGTGAYHLRPFGRPHIEAYFGGTLARELEAGGDAAFFDFAASELTGLLGNDFAKRIKPIRMHRWGADPFARGSYSFALPGKADERATLARPVDDRLFFAGEACSRSDYSTAHGAFLTGVAAADQVLAVRRKAKAP